MSRANESCPDVTVLNNSMQVSAQVGLLRSAGASQVTEIAVDVIAAMVGSLNVTLVVSEENARFESKVLDTANPRVSAFFPQSVRIHGGTLVTT